MTTYFQARSDCENCGQSHAEHSSDNECPYEIDGHPRQCESCADRDSTYAGKDSNFPTWNGNDYECQTCKQWVTPSYCRGHDLYFESSCPNCDENKVIAEEFEEEII